MSESVGLPSMFRADPPWVCVAETHGAAERASLQEKLARGSSVVTFDCSELTTVDELFDITAERLSFPDYFGRNWPAFNECLSEVNEWLPIDSLVLLFENSRSLLSAEPRDLPALFRAIEGAAETLGTEIRDVAWARPAVPFHVILDPGLDAALIGRELPVLQWQ